MLHEVMSYARLAGRSEESSRYRNVVCNGTSAPLTLSPRMAMTTSFDGFTGCNGVATVRVSVRMLPVTWVAVLRTVTPSPTAVTVIGSTSSYRCPSTCWSIDGSACGSSKAAA